MQPKNYITMLDYPLVPILCQISLFCNPITLFFMHCESETDVTPSSYPRQHLLLKRVGTATPAITHVSLTRTSYNAIDE